MKKRLLSLAAVLLCLALLLPLSVWAEEAAAAPSLSLDPAELTLVKGRAQKLKTVLEHVENPRKAKYTWESSDPAVAAVDGGGNVRAVAAGTAQITCTAALEDGSTLAASASVTVTVPVQTVKIGTKGNTPVPYGESLQLEFSVLPEDATDPAVAWTSSDEGVLRVDEKGAVTAVSAGKATVTGTAGGKSAKVNLYVPTLHPSSVSFEVTAENNVFLFTYCGNDFDGNVQLAAKGDCFGYSLIRNDPEIGVQLTALKAGKGTLTVTDRKDGAAKFTVDITVTESALPVGRVLVIQDAAYDPQSGILTVKWTNTGSLAVTGAEIRIHPLDAEGTPVTAGEGDIEDIALERRVLHATAAAAPGETVSASLIAGRDYPGTQQMLIAFDRLEMTAYAEDGTVQERTVTELPDDRLCWYSTGENAYTEGPENPAPYTAPGDEVFDRAAEARLGITVLPVTGDLAEAYGFGHSGVLIVAVEEDSPAAAAGLEAGDLIWRANGTEYASEPYMMTLAAATLAEGQPAVFDLERDNEYWELSLTPAEAGNPEE